MSIYRSPRRQHWTVVDQQVINDDRLSFRARGILLWLLDKPDNWSCRSEAIIDAGKEGRDAVRSALQELLEAGYLQRQRVQDEKGHWSTVTEVLEAPMPGNPSFGEPGAITSTEE